VAENDDENVLVSEELLLCMQLDKLELAKVITKSLSREEHAATDILTGNVK